MLLKYLKKQFIKYAVFDQLGKFHFGTQSYVYSDLVDYINRNIYIFKFNPSDPPLVIQLKALITEKNNHVFA